MSSLSFPDVNVWLALATIEHVHAGLARRWWKEECGRIGFSRFTQLGFLRLMTMAAAMDGKPLTIAEAWRVYDRFWSDDRVLFIAEPPDFEPRFRRYAAGSKPSPKIWADCWLLAFADAGNGTLVTFDEALATRGARCLLPSD